MNGVKVGDWCHAKAVKKVTGKGINFLEGGPGEVADLTEYNQLLNRQSFRKSILVYN